MKRINVIVMILFAPLAIYLLYVTWKDSWTITDRILMIIFLAGGLINSSIMNGTHDGITKSKNKLIRFASYSVILVISLYMGFRLIDHFKGTSIRSNSEDLVLALLTGVLTSAMVVFLNRRPQKPKS
jgi:hypothetical protein